MTAQFSDFLAAHRERVSDIWARAPASTRPAGPVAAAHEPKQLVNALLVALTADDLQPLTAYYELDQPGVERRLERALLDISAVRRAAGEVAAEQGLDHDAALALEASASDELDGVARHLAIGCVNSLSARLDAATSASSARETSLSITMHELRRPLTILNSYGQLLTAGMLGTLPESAMVAIEGITSSTETMVRMVNALAEVARLEDPEDRLAFEVLSAEELVDASLEQLAVEANLRDAEFATDVEPGLEVAGDRRRLILALTNLFGNAVKHGPQGARIDVTVRSDPAGVHFLVRDHGGGFPPADAGRLFEKYFRSVDERHRKIPGSGLGLYIVKTIAERHQGSVSARSAPGDGAEFEMIIPMRENIR